LDDQEEYTSASFDSSLIGKEGEYVRKGRQVTVIDGEGAHVIVKIEGRNGRD
jgi:translation elongation factor P/translation initiation factor 5A